MKVRCYPSDTTGSGRYRMRYPAQAAIAAGADVYLSTGEKGDGLPIERMTQGGRNYVRPKPIDADVLVLQRIADETSVAILPAIQQAGIAIVVDIDDDLSALPPTHPACKQLNPRLSPHMNWRLLERACRIADMVTVSTPALARVYGSHGRVAVLPNCVPERMLDMPRNSDGMTVGWTGWTVSHPGDLRVTGGGVADAIRRVPGAHYLQIGPAHDVRRQLALDSEPESTGGLPEIEDYYTALGRLDVGITPLDDTRFNSAKSWLKPLEMAARGVAPVMSPRADYALLHSYGVGLLAEDRGRAWRRDVELLLTDLHSRTELVERGREAIRDRWTYEARGERWIEAWERAVAHRRAQRPEAVAA